MKHAPVAPFITLAVALFAAQAPADVIVGLKLQPEDTAITVSAVPDHAFATTFKDNTRTIEVSVKVKAGEDGQYRVNIKFAERKNGTRSVDTTIVAKVGEKIELSKAGEGDEARVVTMTITEKK